MEQAHPSSPEAETPGLKYLSIGKLNPQKGSWYSPGCLRTIAFVLPTPRLSNRVQSKGGGKQFHVPPRGEDISPSNAHLVTSICCPISGKYTILGPATSLRVIMVQGGPGHLEKNDQV